MAELLEKTQSSYFLAFKTIFKEVICGKCLSLYLYLYDTISCTRSHPGVCDGVQTRTQMLSKSFQ